MRWRQKVDRFSSYQPQLYSHCFLVGNARAVLISTNRSQNDIQTNQEITHFWYVHLELSAGLEGNSVGSRIRDRCGKIYFKMSNLPTFRRMRKKRKDYSDGRQQHRFVISIIFWMGVRVSSCAYCKWKRMSRVWNPSCGWMICIWTWSYSKPTLRHLLSSNAARVHELRHV